MDKISQIELLANKPLGLSLAYAEYLQQFLQGDMNIQLPEVEAAVPKIEAMHFGGNHAEGYIAMLPIHGSLAHRSSWFDLGYNTIKGWIYSALENDEVKGIILEKASGGGEIAGLFDFCDFVKEASQIKPIWSIVNEHSMSADFCISAATNRIIVPRSGSVGSMGVVMAHYDVSEQMKEAGVKVTLIHKGANKVKGNSYEPLDENIKKALEASLDQPYNQMITQLSGHLGLSEEALKNTEASTYDAESALQIGLIHEVMSADDAIEAFSEHLTNSSDQFIIGGKALKPVKKEGVSVEHQKLIDDAYEEGQKDGKAGAKAATDEEVETRAKQIADAEIERVNGILGSDEAIGREDLAEYLSEQGASVDEALKMLGKAPKAPVENTDTGKTGKPAGDTDNFADGRKTDDVDASTDLNVPGDEVEEELDADGKKIVKGKDDEEFGKRQASITSFGDRLKLARESKAKKRGVQ